MKIHLNRNRAIVSGAAALVVGLGALGVLGAVVWNIDTASDEPSVTIPDLTAFGGEALNRDYAEAMLEFGKPVLLGLPDGDSSACHSLLLVPNPDADLGVETYIYNHSGARTEGASLDREGMYMYGCASSRDIDIPRTVDPDAAPLPHPLDIAAMTAAKVEGLPFLALEQDGTQTYVVIDGETWWLGHRGLAAPEGEALSLTRQ